MCDFENLTSADIFNTGKKLYIAGDYSKSLEYLCQCCKLISAEMNDALCDELFEPYLYYGKSLYMFHKFSADCLGDGVTNIIEENEEEEEAVGEEEEIEEEEEEVEGEEKDENNITKKDDDEEKMVVEEEEDIEGEVKEDKEVEEKENIDEQTTEKGEEKETMITEDNVEEALSNNAIEINNNGGEKEEVEEEVGYLQMSYETVECAKLILQRQIKENKDATVEQQLDRKMADCCDLTADIYVEEGNIKEAIDQYNCALKLKLKHSLSSSTDRLLAESYYKIGVAFNIDYQYNEAKVNFTKAKEILLAIRKKKEAEVSDLQEILKDLEEKIVEVEEGEREYQMAKEALTQFMTVPKATALDDNVSQLVTRKNNKRTREADAADKEGPSSDKIAKTD